MPGCGGMSCWLINATLVSVFEPMVKMAFGGGGHIITTPPAPEHLLRISEAETGRLYPVYPPHSNKTPGL